VKPGFRKNDQCERGRCLALGLAVLVLIAPWPAVLQAAAQDSEELFSPFFVAKNALPPMDQSSSPAPMVNANLRVRSSTSRSCAPSSA